MKNDVMKNEAMKNEAMENDSHEAVMGAPERTGTTPSYWRDWAFGLLVMGAVTLLAAETGTARPVGALLLGFGAVIGAVAVGKRIVAGLRTAADHPRPDKPYGSHAV